MKSMKYHHIIIDFIVNEIFFHIFNVKIMISNNKKKSYYVNNTNN